MSKKPKVISIVGPTSSGKTTLSIKIAQYFNGEVISADSRQVYRGLDIGTGKVTEEEMEGVPHHLIDVVDVNEIYTGANFVKDANTAIATILKNGRLPIIAGGTFFYTDLLRGKMMAAPVEPDNEFRDTLERYSNEELLDLLRQKDAQRADSIDPHNRRRLVRALEIIHTLGTIPEQKTADSDYDWLIIGVEVEKEMLRKKFSIRLEEWLERGFLEEVANIEKATSPERFQELGFEYTLTTEFINKKITKEELFEKFIQKNWQYAKRQMTWLKRDAEIEWFEPSNTEEICQRIEKFLSE